MLRSLPRAELERQAKDAHRLADYLDDLADRREREAATEPSADGAVPAGAKAKRAQLARARRAHVRRLALRGYENREIRASLEANGLGKLKQNTVSKLIAIELAWVDRNGVDTAHMQRWGNLMASDRQDLDLIQLTDELVSVIGMLEDGRLATDSIEALFDREIELFGRIIAAPAEGIEGARAKLVAAQAFFRGGLDVPSSISPLQAFDQALGMLRVDGRNDVGRPGDDREWRELGARFEAARVKGHNGTTDEVWHDYWKVFDEVEATPASSPAGAEVKLAALCDFERMRACNDANETRDRLLSQAVAALAG
jgi:hypothetical protein